MPCARGCLLTQFLDSTNRLMVEHQGEYPAQTYIDLAIAYLAMNLIHDAIKTITSGLEHYPTEPGLRQLLKDVRLRGHKP